MSFLPTVKHVCSRINERLQQWRMIFNPAITQYTTVVQYWDVQMKEKKGRSKSSDFPKKEGVVPCSLQKKYRTTKQWVSTRLDPMQTWQLRCGVEIRHFQPVVLKYLIHIVYVMPTSVTTYVRSLLVCGNSVQTLDRTSMPFHCLLTCSRSNTNKLLLILQLEEYRLRQSNSKQTLKRTISKALCVCCLWTRSLGFLPIVGNCSRSFLQVWQHASPVKCDPTSWIRKFQICVPALCCWLSA